MEYRKKFVLTSLITAGLSALLLPLASFVYKQTGTVILKDALFGGVFALGLIFSLMYFFLSGKLDYDNAEHPYRFLLVYLISLALTMLFPLIDQKAWIFLGIGVALSLFSNSLMGIYSVSGLIMISCLLSEHADKTTFVVYFISSFVGVLLFQDIEHNFKVGSSIFISSVFLFVVETAGFVLPENKALSAEQFLMPLVNVMVNVLALFWCLKYFNEFVANRYRNKYLELNDQEYKILIELKNKNKDEYFRSIHTAYLVERIASAIGCDVLDAKNCAYYHRIKKAFSYNLEDIRKFVKENGFPPRAAEVLLEFYSKSSKLESREASIVYISDKFISTLQAIFKKDPKAVVNYKDLIETILEKDYVMKTIAESKLTLNDMRIIREIILKENLYYDFLR